MIDFSNIDSLDDIFNIENRIIEELHNKGICKYDGNGFELSKGKVRGIEKFQIFLYSKSIELANNTKNLVQNILKSNNVINDYNITIKEAA